MGVQDCSGVGSERIVTGHGGNPPGNGPFVSLTLCLQGDHIAGASYETYQCPGAHACGKAVCELIRGKNIQEARKIRHEDLVARVGPLPKHRQICYGLSLLALSNALFQLETK